MREIKAIEMVYNGYKFRSRLEARWAVFFDAAGIKYEYEPEGFKNAQGECYLPDFYLPDYDYWVEVKPYNPKRYKELIKAAHFVGDKIKKILILPSIPEESEWNSVYYYWAMYYDSVFENEYMMRRIAITEYDDGFIGFDTSTSLLSPRCHAEVEMLKSPYYSWDARHDNDVHCAFSMFKTPTLDKAYDKARKARFEFGECG